MLKKILLSLIITILCITSSTASISAYTEDYYSVDCTKISDQSISQYIGTFVLKQKDSGWNVIVNGDVIGSIAGVKGDVIYNPNPNISIKISIDINNGTCDFDLVGTSDKVVKSSIYFYPSPYSEDTSMMVDIYPNVDSDYHATLSATLSGTTFKFGSYSYKIDNQYTLNISDIWIDTNTNKGYVKVDGKTIETGEWNKDTRELQVYLEDYVTAQRLELEYMQIGLPKLTYPEASKVGVVNYSETQINNAVKNHRITLKNNQTGLTADEGLIQTITYWERLYTNDYGDGVYNIKVEPRQIQVICQYWEDGVNGRCKDIRNTFTRTYAVFGDTYTYPTVKTEEATKLRWQVKNVYGGQQDAFPANYAEYDKIQYKYKQARATTLNEIPYSEYVALKTNSTSEENYKGIEGYRYVWYTFSEWIKGGVKASTDSATLSSYVGSSITTGTNTYPLYKDGEVVYRDQTGNVSYSNQRYSYVASCTDKSIKDAMGTMQSGTMVTCSPSANYYIKYSQRITYGDWQTVNYNNVTSCSSSFPTSNGTEVGCEIRFKQNTTPVTYGSWSTDYSTSCSESFPSATGTQVKCNSGYYDIEARTVTVGSWSSPTFETSCSSNATTSCSVVYKKRSRTISVGDWGNTTYVSSCTSSDKQNCTYGFYDIQARTVTVGSWSSPTFETSCSSSSVDSCESTKWRKIRTITVGDWGSESWATTCANSGSTNCRTVYKKKTCNTQTYSYSGYGNYSSSKYGDYQAGCTSRYGANSECGVKNYSYGGWTYYYGSKGGDYTSQCTSTTVTNSNCGTTTKYTASCSCAAPTAYKNKTCKGTASTSKTPCTISGCTSRRCTYTESKVNNSCTRYYCPTTRTTNYNSCTSYSCPSGRSVSGCSAWGNETIVSSCTAATNSVSCEKGYYKKTRTVTTGSWSSGSYYSACTASTNTIYSGTTAGTYYDYDCTSGYKKSTRSVTYGDYAHSYYSSSNSPSTTTISTDTAAGTYTQRRVYGSALYQLRTRSVTYGSWGESISATCSPSSNTITQNVAAGTYTDTECTAGYSKSTRSVTYGNYAHAYYAVNSNQSSTTITNDLAAGTYTQRRSAGSVYQKQQRSVTYGSTTTSYPLSCSPLTPNASNEATSKVVCTSGYYGIRNRSITYGSLVSEGYVNKNQVTIRDPVSGDAYKYSLGASGVYKKTEIDVTVDLNPWSEWSTIDPDPVGNKYASLVYYKKQTSNNWYYRLPKLHESAWSKNTTDKICKDSDDTAANHSSSDVELQKHSDIKGTPYLASGTLYVLDENWSDWIDCPDSQMTGFNIKNRIYKYRTVKESPIKSLFTGTYAVRTNLTVNTLESMTDSQIKSLALDMDRYSANVELLKLLSSNTEFAKNYVELSENGQENILNSEYLSASRANTNAMQNVAANQITGDKFLNSNLFIPHIYITDHRRAAYKTFNITGYEEVKGVSTSNTYKTTINRSDTGDLILMQEHISRDTKVVYFDYRYPLNNYDGDLPDNWKGYESLLDSIKATNIDDPEGKMSITISKNDLLRMKKYALDHPEGVDDCKFIKEFGYIFNNPTNELKAYLDGTGTCTVNRS